MSKKIKYSDNFERDWKFYTNNVGKFTFWGGDAIFEPIFDANGISAKEFFHKLDSIGMAKMKDKTCCEPKLVSEVLTFKKGLNFHIKQWSEGYEDCGQGVQEYMNFLNDPPEWAVTSFKNQLMKLYKAKLTVETENEEPEKEVI